MRRRIRVRTRWLMAIAAGAFLTLGSAAQEKDTFTPMALDSGFGRMDLTPPQIRRSRLSRNLRPRKVNFSRL